jgi:CheY-like chemotaxis protein
MIPEVLTINGENLAINMAAPFIFLAEDDIDDQELFIQAISIHNTAAQIHSESNGRRAIKFLENLPAYIIPDLIVLDYNMPEADGAQILKFLLQQERYHAVPKVVWSTSNSHIYKQVCLNLGANAYFTKPSNVSGISNLVKEILVLCENK